MPEAAVAERVRPGAAATGWLLETLRALQAGDPLRPVTVVVPSHHAGLALRRRLAAGGYANVRFTVLNRLAESLGAARLSAGGSTPLTPVTRAALLRRALGTAGGPLADGADHAGLVGRVASLAEDLRRTPDVAAAMERIRCTGIPTSRAAAATVAEYERRRIEAGLYDDVDLFVAATEVLTGGDAGSALADVGAVVVHHPARAEVPEAAFLSALAQRVPMTTAEVALGGGTGEPLVIIAPDPVEEVRAAVRGAIAAAEGERSVPLHRIAIVYRDAGTYGPLLRDTLDEAGIPCASLDGVALGESLAARALLGLIGLREQDFSRAAVLGWLSGLPHTGGVIHSQARWDQLSRDAGVVRGAGQWRERLTALAERARSRCEALARDPDDPVVEGRVAALERDAEDALRVVENIVAIDARTNVAPRASWQEYVTWAVRLREEFLPRLSPASNDGEADQQVGEVLHSLTQASAIEPTVDLHVFLRTLEDALAARRCPEGRLGHGVVIGPHHRLRGMDFDRVHILGVVEGSIPVAAPVDPLLPGDPLERRERHEADQRQDWLVTLTVAGAATVSAPVVDVDGRTAYPSPWVLELVQGDSAVSASAMRGGIARHPRLQYAHSYAEVRAATTPLSLAERREAEAERHRGDLAATVLARRDDLPLGTTLRSSRSRRSSDLTEFDGNVAAVVDLSLIARGLGETAQSATGVETWAVCPFRFLLGRVLSVTATNEPDDERWWRIDPGEKGRLIHGILERYYGEVMAGGPGPGTDAGVRRMEAVAAAAFADAAARGVTGHPLAWENERVPMLADLRTLLTRDAVAMEAGGWTPVAVEQAFGYPDDPSSWSAVEVALPDGRTVRLRGFIDRLDARPGAHRITDYKTGKTKAGDVDARHRFDAGRALQLPVYGTALRQHLACSGERAGDVEARYWYVSSGGAFGEVPLTVTDAEEALLGEILRDIDGGARAGCFPQVPGDYREHFGSYANCGFCDYDSLCPANRDVVTAWKRDSPARVPHNALTPDNDEGPA